MYSERVTVDHGVMGVNAYLHNIIVSILGSLWFHHKYAKKSTIASVQPPSSSDCFSSIYTMTILRIVFACFILVVVLRHDSSASENGTVSLYFSLMVSSAAGLNTSKVVPSVERALRDINSDPTILPEHSLHYNRVLDTKVSAVRAPLVHGFNLHQKFCSKHFFFYYNNKHKKLYSVMARKLYGFITRSYNLKRQY